MSAILERDTVADVRDAAAVKSAAAAEVARLTLRLSQIEARAWAVQAERARHMAQVTEALLDGDELPKARPPEVIAPDAALKVVRDALKAADAALTEAAGAHRTAIVRHAEHLRAKAVADYTSVFQSYVERLRTVAAYDKILARTGLPTMLSNLVYSRLQVPALRGDPDAVQGLSLDGHNFFNKPELDQRELEARRAIEQDTGPLPF